VKKYNPKNIVNCGWNEIYKNPKKYRYYNLFEPHENLQEIIEIFSDRNYKKILDLGCGVGRNIIPLVKNGFDVEGIDESSEAIRLLKKHLKDKSLKAKLSVGTFQSLPFPNDYFDAIICIQTLNHGYEKDIKEGFNEMRRVLKPGGAVFMTLPGRISNGKVRYCLVKTAKRVEKNTYIPTIGDEIGLPHFIFNKKIIKGFLKGFIMIKNVWNDKKDYYCVLAKKVSCN